MTIHQKLTGRLSKNFVSPIGSHSILDEFKPEGCQVTWGDCVYRFCFLGRTLGKFAAKCATWGKKLENIRQSNVLEQTSRAAIGTSGRTVWRTLRMGSWTLKCLFLNQRFSHLVPVSCECAVGLRAFGGTHPHHLRQKPFHKIQHWKDTNIIG